MNDRIQALAVEAEEYADTVVDQGGEFHPAYTEKLAQLIVQECLDIISPYAVRMEDFDGGHPIAEIKEHFGVER